MNIILHENVKQREEMYTHDKMVEMFVLWTTFLCTIYLLNCMKFLDEEQVKIHVIKGIWWKSMVHVHEFTKEKAPTNLCLWRPLSSLNKNDVSFQTAICIVLLLKKVNCVNSCSFEALMFSKIVSYVTLYDNVGDCHFQ